MLEEYAPLLQRTTLFRGMTGAELERLCACLGFSLRRYRGGAVIWLTGDAVERAGVVLEGSVRAERLGYGGGHVLTAQPGPGEVFGDVLMSTGETASPVDILAGPGGALILFVPFEGILTGCGNRCPCHDALRRNLLSEISVKFWALRRQLECLSAPGVRSRVCALLLHAAADAGSSRFSLPFDRGGMAAYLCVNRCALSRELSRMAAEGLLVYKKNIFTLSSPEKLYQFLN